MGQRRQSTPNTWIRLSHDFYVNAKILELIHHKQHRAITVYVCGLSWCGANRTDGWIPDYALASIHGNSRDATHLTNAGLWIPERSAGWWIHDWPKWQESTAERDERTQRMRSKAHLRWHGHPDGPTSDVIHLDAQRNA
ncbi:MAG: hypothetical protein WCF04_00160 [Candidatus Nanopelagicales bacterium]